MSVPFPHHQYASSGVSVMLHPFNSLPTDIIFVIKIAKKNLNLKFACNLSFRMFQSVWIPSPQDHQCRSRMYRLKGFIIRIYIPSHASYFTECFSLDIAFIRYVSSCICGACKCPFLLNIFPQTWHDEVNCQVCMQVSCNPFVWFSRYCMGHEVYCRCVSSCGFAILLPEWTYDEVCHWYVLLMSLIPHTD